MSRTKHHKEYRHYGHDYGSRHNCNRRYNNSYGKFGRKRLHSELRIEDKEVVRAALEDTIE